MPINFFETEVRKLQDQFNEVFGDCVVCNVRTRQVAIMSICNLGLLSRKLSKANNKDRHLIQSFMKRKTILKNLFNNQMKGESNAQTLQIQQRTRQMDIR